MNRWFIKQYRNSISLKTKKSWLLLYFLLASFVSDAQSYNLDQGLKAYNEGELDQALEYFSREITDDPNSGFALYYRAAIYSYKEQNALALRDISNAIKNFTSKQKKWLVAAYRIRAGIYRSIDNYEKSLEDYSKAIKVIPSDPEIYTDRAQVYFDLEQFDNAEADYKQALKIDESMLIAYAGLGRNYINQKNFAEAEKILDLLIKLAPDYPSAYKFRGQLSFEKGEFDRAIEDLFYAMELDDTDKTMRTIFILYAQKNYPLAIAKVNGKIAAEPEKEIWYLTRGQLYEGKNDYWSAAQDYSKLMEIAAEEVKPQLLSIRARCYSKAGLYEPSIADYSAALELDTANAFYYAYRGDVNRLMGNYKNAKDDLTKAIGIDPAESWFYYRRGWIEEGFLNEIQAGLDDYNEAIALNKEYAYAYLNRGRLYDLKIKDSVRARADYLRILDLDTAIDANSNCRQYALFHLDRNEEAVAWQTKILENYPSDGNYYDAACLYSLMNKPSDAISSLSMAFQKGYRNFIHMSKDDDLENIRNLPGYVQLLEEWKAKHSEATKGNAVQTREDVQDAVQSVTIPMKSKGSGTYEVPCKINDLGLNLIFDTGASDISISQTEVQFMLKNGYLSPNDITGTQSYMDANGDVEVGTTIIFRRVDFGGLVLKNVKASVVHSKNAPLLFGQSALSKYGKILIDNDRKVIVITK